MSTLESSGKILVMKKAEGEKGSEGFVQVTYRRVHSTFVGKNVSNGEKIGGSVLNKNAAKSSNPERSISD